MTKARRWFLWLGLATVAVVPSRGAILYTEEFTAGTNGWGDRDAGEMTVSHNAGGYLQGVFGPTFLPQSDAFRIDSVNDTGGNFTGDYVTPGLTQIAFDLYAATILPSDLFIRLISGANVFYYAFTPLNVLSWDTYTVDLQWSFGWVGLSEATFNAALASVDAIDIQITRNGNSAQTYYLDNVRTLDTDIGDPGGPTAVPEPGTMNLILFVAMLMFAVRRHFARESFSAG